MADPANDSIVLLVTYWSEYLTKRNNVVRKESSIKRLIQVIEIFNYLILLADDECFNEMGSGKFMKKFWPMRRKDQIIGRQFRLAYTVVIPCH